jgi:hypothetical protein
MWDCAKNWAQIAPGFTPIVALIAVLLAWRQLALNRANQRETTAKTTFRDFLKLAVEHPELSAGNYETIAKSERLLEQYEWFVGYFLWAAEELFEFTPREDVWSRNLQLLANYHSAYFKNSSDFRTREFDTYSAKTKALIEHAIASSAAN